MTDTVNTLRLPDGRDLAWAEHGDPGGVPVVAVHGSPDSRIIWRLVDEAARSVGARIIAPDRPGFGLSSPLPGRAVTDWVADLDALLAHLDLDSYRMVAVSGGSPYALAAAHAHGDRIAHLGLLSVICPLYVPGVTKEANRQVRTMFWVARRAPWLLGPMARAMVRMTMRDVDAAAQRLISMRPPADREIIERPDVMAVLMENLPNQFRDPASIALEMANAARPWGFELAEVTVPTTVWHGGLDDVHTPAMGRYLAEHLPEATLVFEPDYGTFNFFDDAEALLTTLVAPTEP